MLYLPNMIQTSFHVDNMQRLADFINEIENRLSNSGSMIQFQMILDDLRDRLRPLVTIEEDYYRLKLIELIERTKDILYGALPKYSFIKTSFSNDYSTTSIPYDCNGAVKPFLSTPIFPVSLHYRNCRTFQPVNFAQNTDDVYYCPYKIGDPPFSANSAKTIGPKDMYGEFF